MRKIPLRRRKESGKSRPVGCDEVVVDASHLGVTMTEFIKTDRAV